MKQKVTNIVFLVSAQMFCSPLIGQEDSIVLKGLYLGQKPPGLTPKIFAPGIVSTGLDELSPAFSPDGKTLVFSVQMLGCYSEAL